MMSTGKVVYFAVNGIIALYDAPPPPVLLLKDTASRYPFPVSINNSTPTLGRKKSWNLSRSFFSAKLVFSSFGVKQRYHMPLCL